MRIISSIVVAVLIGVLVGGSLAYVDIRSDPDALSKLAGKTEPGSLPGGGKNLPRIQVDEPHFNFGSMQRGTSKSHDFVIRNVGNAPLELPQDRSHTTCKCTLSTLPEKPIPPGGSATVTLKWSAKADSGPFSQTATIGTNDPMQSQIELVIEGQISATSGVEPNDFLFDKLSVGEVKSAQVYVMAMLQDELTVKDPEFSDPSLRDKLDVKIEPVERDVLPTKAARRGVRVTVTTKPNLPVGRFNTWLELHTNLPEAEKLDVLVNGQVVGDIDVKAPVGWNDEQGVLVIGSVKSSEGGHGKVNLIVRGSEASGVEFKVKSVEPPQLKVKIGKPVKLTDTLVHVPVDIEIPRGTRPMVHLDTVQGEAGRIVFETTHSKVKEISVGVRFAVER